jgi:hypothetical protein
MYRMTVKITLTLPDNLRQYIKDKGLSPSRFFQNKLKEEIIAEGKAKQYHIEK